MEETFGKLSGDQFIGFVSVVGGIATGLVITLALIVTPYWRRVRETESTNQLKRDLITAGFTADDIERVVRATTTATGTRARKVGCCGRSNQLSQV